MKNKPAPALPSATTVVLRDRSEVEVLLLQRNAKIKFHGGSWVFPGGKLDSVDWPVGVESFEALSPKQRDLAYQNAAIREAKEESGLDIPIEQLNLFSTWLTPIQMPKRFDAWFYLAICPDQPVVIDDGEIKDYQWLSPKAALALQAEGKISLPPPTFVTLSRLAHFPDATTAIEHLSAAVYHFEPVLVPIENGFVTLYEGDAGYRDARLDTPGRQHRLIKKGNHFDYICSG